MKKILLLALAIMPLAGWGQTLKQSGTSPQDVIPEGWKIQYAYGDMNKDGVLDLAVIAFPEEETAAPLLGIYWRTKSGLYRLYHEYAAFPANDNGLVIPEYDLSISDKGVLSIEYSVFYTAGSWSTDRDTYRFRYQQGDFFLIGHDTGSLMRNTGEVTEVSLNFLTHKRQTVKYNVLEGNDERSEKWSRIPKEPLISLSDWRIEEM
ncbi:MAG: hypothetical protein IKX36_11215 [Prevotella sp.]|nr:hypothetical protein [Prevotella sp.]